jgi:hypothetical protein
MTSFVTGEAFMGSPHFTGVPARAAIEAGERAALGIEPGVAAARRRAMEEFAGRAGIQIDPQVAAAIKEYAERPPAGMGLEPQDSIRPSGLFSDDPALREYSRMTANAMLHPRSVAPLLNPAVGIRRVNA